MAWRKFHYMKQQKKSEKEHNLDLQNQLEDLSHKYNKEIDTLTQRLDEANKQVA